MYHSSHVFIASRKNRILHPLHLITSFSHFIAAQPWLSGFPSTGREVEEEVSPVYLINAFIQLP